MDCRAKWQKSIVAFVYYDWSEPVIAPCPPKTPRDRASCTTNIRLNDPSSAVHPLSPPNCNPAGFAALLPRPAKPLREKVILQSDDIRHSSNSKPDLYVPPCVGLKALPPARSSGCGRVGRLAQGGGGGKGRAPVDEGLGDRARETCDDCGHGGGSGPNCGAKGARNLLLYAGYRSSLCMSCLD